MKKWTQLLCCWGLALPLWGQTITAHQTFHAKEALSTARVEDDLYLRFNLGQSLEELAKEKEIVVEDNLYGEIKVSLDDFELSTGTILLAPKQMLMLKEFDLLFAAVMKQFHSLAMEHKEEWTTKDDLLVQVLAQANNPMNCWMKAVAARAIEGEEHVAKVELYLSKDAETSSPKGEAICSGTFKLKVDKGTLLPLYGSKIPALYRPIPDHGIPTALHQKNIGKIACSTTAIDAMATKASFKHSFDLSKDKAIYGRAYFPKSIRNIGAGVGQDKVCAVTVQYYVNDVLKETVVQPLEATACQKKTSLSMVWWQKEDVATKDEWTSGLAQILGQLEEGTHKIKINLMFNYKDGEEELLLPLATTTLEIKK